MARCPAPAIVYEDADLLVVEKPAGMVVHPAFGHHGDTLLDALAAYTPSVSSPDATPQPRPVHRLDKDTSGLLVLARTLQAHRYLSYQWRRQTVVRCYLALIQGRSEPPDGAIELPLARNPQNRQRVIPTPDGRPARTLYTTLQQHAGYSLLDVQPESGRMHQIRVHLAAIGHPVCGDPQYGTRGQLGLERQFLHATRLAFAHPVTGAEVDVTSPLPPDLSAALERAA